MTSVISQMKKLDRSFVVDNISNASSSQLFSIGSVMMFVGDIHSETEGCGCECECACFEDPYEDVQLTKVLDFNSVNPNVALGVMTRAAPENRVSGEDFITAFFADEKTTVVRDPENHTITVENGFVVSIDAQTGEAKAYEVAPGDKATINTDTGQVSLSRGI
jgi:hypothetical protein